jgi:hypothetical protein
VKSKTQDAGNNLHVLYRNNNQNKTTNDFSSIFGSGIQLQVPRERNHETVLFRFFLASKNRTTKERERGNSRLTSSKLKKNFDLTGHLLSHAAIRHG